MITNDKVVWRKWLEFCFSLDRINYGLLPENPSIVPIVLFRSQRAVEDLECA